jgi:hypothetical protein
VLRFISDTDWIIKYYLDELRLQRVKMFTSVLMSTENKNEEIDDYVLLGFDAL